MFDFIVNHGTDVIAAASIVALVTNRTVPASGKLAAVNRLLNILAVNTARRGKE